MPDSSLFWSQQSSKVLSVPMSLFLTLDSFHRNVSYVKNLKFLNDGINGKRVERHSTWWSGQNYHQNVLGCSHRNICSTAFYPILLILKIYCTYCTVLACYVISFKDIDTVLSWNTLLCKKNKLHRAVCKHQSRKIHAKYTVRLVSYLLWRHFPQLRDNPHFTEIILNRLTLDKSFIFWYKV